MRWGVRSSDGGQPRGGISSSEKRGGRWPAGLGHTVGMGVSDRVPLAPGQGGGWNGGFSQISHQHLRVGPNPGSASPSS